MTKRKLMMMASALFITLSAPFLRTRASFPNWRLPA